ncbi:MAG: hypothetical protein JWP89_2203 [Schlesneria sp.]|nr:hypothetical protein [Schlesneria sp.]
MTVTSLPVHSRIAAVSRLAWLTIALLGLSVDQVTFAQAGGAHGSSGAHGSGGPGRPPGLPGMPGMPGRTGGPGAPAGPPIPGQANPNALKGPPTELKIDSETLPKKFAPPAAKAEVMDLDQPLAMQDEIDKLKKDLAKYQTVMRTAKSTDADKILIRNGIRYRLALMCLKKNRLELSKLHEDLTRDLNSAASAPEAANANAIKSFRQIVMQEIVSQAGPLLVTQPFHVRLHIALLLGELNLTEENPKFALKLEAYSPVCEPLLQVISSPDQPEGVKIVAVNGLARNLRLGNANVTVRTKVAQALVAELSNKKAHSWYQMRLAAALAAMDVDLVQGKPIVVDVLKAVLADDERTWTVRAEAARSLGRVPLPAACNPPSVTKAVAAFALKLAKAAQQAPQTKGDESKWKGEFFKLYLAFQQFDATDLMADKKSKAGLLNNSQAAAAPAYALIHPLVAAILQAQRLTVQQVQALEDWVKPPAEQAKPEKPATSSPAEGGGAAPMSVRGGPQKI